MDRGEGPSQKVKTGKPRSIFSGDVLYFVDRIWGEIRGKSGVPPPRWTTCYSKAEVRTVLACLGMRRCFPLHGKSSVV